MNYYKNLGEEPTAKDSKIIESQATIEALRAYIVELESLHLKDLDKLRTLVRNLRKSIDDLQRENISAMLNKEKQTFNPNKMYDGLPEV